MRQGNQHARLGSSPGALEACDHFTTATLERIDLGGRIIVNTYENNAAPLTASATG
jgi:hypothetical protein